MSQQRASAVTIGFFDGVHLGHQQLLSRCRAAAAARGLRTVAVTFDLHRAEVLQERGPLRTILTTDEKVACLHDYGMEHVHVIHFTPEFAAQPGEMFVRQALADELGAEAVVVGYDFRFGHDRACDLDDLARFGRQFGFSVEVVQPVLLRDERVSSKLIRELLANGEVARAASLLGRPYSLSGPVVEGARLGRQLGFPTANIAPDPRKIVPDLGVYVAEAELDGTQYGAVVNLGRRPTVAVAGEVTVEAHLLDVDGDLYGRRLTLNFLARLRAEQKFANLDQLRAQIARDVAEARRIFG